jgi:DNA polymerase-3 subunit delta
MQLKGEQLAAHLERELKAGLRRLWRRAAAGHRSRRRHPRRRPRRGFDEREVLTAIAGFNWNDLHHAAGNMSLFGGRKLIDLRIPTGKPGREGSAAIQDYCARPSPDACCW